MTQNEFDDPHFSDAMRSAINRLTKDGKGEFDVRIKSQRPNIFRRIRHFLFGWIDTRYFEWDFLTETIQGGGRRRWKHIPKDEQDKFIRSAEERKLKIHITSGGTCKVIKNIELIPSETQHIGMVYHAERGVDFGTKADKGKDILQILDMLENTFFLDLIKRPEIGNYIQACAVAKDIERVKYITGTTEDSYPIKRLRDAMDVPLPKKVLH